MLVNLVGEFGDKELCSRRGISGWVKKGKAIPLQAWTAPEVSRRMRLPDFKTIGT